MSCGNDTTYLIFGGADYISKFLSAKFDIIRLQEVFVPIPFYKIKKNIFEMFKHRPFHPFEIKTQP